MKNYIILFSLFTFSYANIFSFNFVSLENLLKKHQNIKYRQCFSEINFKIEPFKCSSLVPFGGYFKETFILEIPNGKVQGKEGLVFIENEFIKEMVWAERYEFLNNVSPVASNSILKIPGTVAVISQVANDNFCHFFYEVLGRLAMLELLDINYDWLYVFSDKKFIKEGLILWGVDESKIISPPFDSNFCIQADNLILPSLVLNTNNGFKHTGVNAHPYTLRYVREKLLSKIIDKVDTSKFSKKIFISRRDAPARRIANEDEVFECFKEKGFERYDTGTMSLVEQIALFAQADIVVGEHGAGLTNVLFCKEGTKFIEIFQALIDSSFWFPAQIFNLEYIPVNSLNIDGNSFYNWQELNPNVYYHAQLSRIKIPLDEIKRIVHTL